MNKKIKAALYLRVSTTDKGQDTDNQLLQLKEYCQKKGYDIYQVYVDHESGRKGRSVRKQFNQMFKDAAQHHFDLVAFWSLDRFSRRVKAGLGSAKSSLLVAELPRPASNNLREVLPSRTIS